MPVPKDNRPHVQVLVNGLSVVALLDSGASVSVMSQSLAIQLGLYSSGILSSAIRVQTADGSSHRSLDSINVPIIYEKEEKNITIHIFGALSKSLILGINFWNLFGLQIEKVFEVSLEGALIDRHHLSTEEIAKLEAVITKFPVTPSGKLNITPVIQHDIDTGDAAPIRQRPYVFSPYINEQVVEEVKRMIDLDIIEPSPHPSWMNPVIAVKKTNGKIRLCMDARKLNSVTIKDAYPPQSVNRILANLRGTKYLSAIDLKDAYYQIELRPEAREKTSFSVISLGAFRYRRMPMGLCNSGATLSKLMDMIVGARFEPYVFVYLDDLIVATDSFEHHLEMLAEVAAILTKANLTISTEKSHFCKAKITYLGYQLDAKGLKADPQKIQPILDYPIPKSVRDVRRFLGLSGWYRRFIRDYSEITAPLTDLLKTKSNSIKWTDAANEAFEKLKVCLSTPPILAMPDFTKRFFVHCDASDVGIGAVLAQTSENDEGQDVVIAFFSAKLNDAEKNYYTTEKECLAAVRSADYFRPYVDGVEFTFIVDHASLLWLLSCKDPTGRLARWTLRLQAYNFTMIHRKGRDHLVADAMSRAVAAVTIELMSETADEEYRKLRQAIMNAPGTHRDYELHENTIVWKTKDGVRKLLVPSNWRARIIYENHNLPTSGHLGAWKTAERIAEKYTWPGMYKQIREAIKNCTICRGIKPTNRIEQAPTAIEDVVPAERPFFRFSMDFQGPFPCSTSGNTWLLVAVDDFSKFVVMEPMRTATTKSTIKFLLKRIVLFFGAPRFVISDRGRQFYAHQFTDTLEKYGIEWVPTPAYHPQANATEAANKTITNAIRAYITNDLGHKKWDEHIDEIACALNSSVHSTTSMTPYEVLFGMPYRLLGIEHVGPLAFNESEMERRKRIELIREKVVHRISEAKAKWRTRYNLRTRKRTYANGEQVWRRNFKLSDKSKGFAHKLAPRYIPAIVEDRIGQNAYRLRDIGGRTRVFPARHIK